MAQQQAYPTAPESTNSTGIWAHRGSSGRQQGARRPSNTTNTHKGTFDQPYLYDQLETALGDSFSKRTGRQRQAAAATDNNKHDNSARKWFSSSTSGGILTTARRHPSATEHRWDDEEKVGEHADRFRAVRRLAWFFMALVLVCLVVYYLPQPPFDPVPRWAPRGRPKLEGPLALNDELNQAETLFEGRIRAPESMAVDSHSNFYTGVEGGFILYVDTRHDLWHKVARLNANATLYRANVSDHLSSGADLDVDSVPVSIRPSETLITSGGQSGAESCELDAQLYGERARFLPEAVHVSRCSRPLGVRLSPDETYLYAVDPYQGLFRVDLSRAEPLGSSLLAAPSLFNFEAAAAAPLPNATSALMREVSLLVDFRQAHRSLAEAGHAPRILFGDDLVVDWRAGPTGGDIIYMTDCSTKWPLRDLLLMMLENDQTGRLLRYDTRAQLLSVVAGVAPARHRPGYAPGPPLYDDSDLFDPRPLSFPNGLELMDGGQALLMSDLNNGRILKHYVRGPRLGTTEHWAWVPGNPDNIKRGADPHRETYWVGCGCAVWDHDHFELMEWIADYPVLLRFLVKFATIWGRLTEFLGRRVFRWPAFADIGHAISHVWLSTDPLCMHGVVLQFDRNGRPLRTLHAPNFSSKWKLISEAREIIVPINELEAATTTGTAHYDPLDFILSHPAQVSVNGSTSGLGSTSASSSNRNEFKRYLYLGSVYNSYLGRIELEA